RDAAGPGQLFECVHVPGITDVREGMNGFALADLNGDGRPDLIATYSPPTAHRVSRLAVLINEGGFRFRPHQIAISGSALTMADFRTAAQIPNCADLNGDGFLDLLVTRSAFASAGRVRSPDGSPGNTLLVSDGAWDRFVDASDRMGLRNELAYNRQTSFGDVNGDGHLDVAIGCDNIKNALGGVPHSRLYVFRPHGAEFAAGRFEDLGGTDLVPDFGGFYHDSAKDKAGPGLGLRDLDNDGDLDLVQSYHCDVRDPLAPYSPGEYRQGVMCWRNLFREAGELRFEKVINNGLHCEARLRYNREKQVYEPASDARAPGLPYVSFADVDYDGLLDVLAVGPSSDYWAPRVEDVGGRFWRNLGGFRFENRTGPAGLGPINNTYRKWLAFFDEPMPARLQNWQPRGRYESQPGKVPNHPLDELPYYADAILGDYDNDGWQDVVVLNRSESRSPRAVLFLGRAGGTFAVQPTTFSGLDSAGICGEASDLDGDGLLDLIFAADPDNSVGPGQTPAPPRYESRVYWNTGEQGARQNHWLRLRFAGVSDAQLIGARVELSTAGAKQYSWIHSNHSYKSGGALDAHFGVGQATSADVRVTLLDGRTVAFPDLTADQSLILDLRTSRATPVPQESQP
ncbi:MAG: CRTAC1 family protein, partial [Armatimonadetes bacterium]|nr:CRTAC1 family protein [Armatimonadota bacterium]